MHSGSSLIAADSGSDRVRGGGEYGRASARARLVENAARTHRPLAAESLGALLRCLGAEVVAVHDGPAALEALRTEKSCEAVLDIGKRIVR